MNLEAFPWHARHLKRVLGFVFSALCNRLAGKNIKWTNNTTEYIGTLVASL